MTQIGESSQSPIKYASSNFVALFPKLPFFRVEHVVIGAGRFSTSFECQLFANNKQILERQQQPCWAGNLICKNVRNEWTTGRVGGEKRNARMAAIPGDVVPINPFPRSTSSGQKENGAGKA